MKRTLSLAPRTPATARLSRAALLLNLLLP